MLSRARWRLDLKGSTIIAHFDDQWLPRWERDANGAWVLPYPRPPYVMFDIDLGPVAKDNRYPTRIAEREVSIACGQGNEHDLKFAKKFFSFLPRIAARPQCGIEPDYAPVKRPAQSGIWMGKGALAWVRGDSDRVLGWDRISRIGYRPWEGS